MCLYAACAQEIGSYCCCCFLRCSDAHLQLGCLLQHHLVLFVLMICDDEWPRAASIQHNTQAEAAIVSGPTLPELNRKHGGAQDVV